MATPYPNTDQPTKYCQPYPNTINMRTLAPGLDTGCVSVFEMCICVRSGQEQSHDVIEIKTFFFISFLFFFFFFFLVCAVPSAAPQNLSLEVRNSKVKLYIAFVHFYW